MRQCGNVAMRQCGNAAMRQCGMHLDEKLTKLKIGKKNNP